jgi:hypothetical protein
VRGIETLADLKATAASSIIAITTSRRSSSVAAVPPLVAPSSVPRGWPVESSPPQSASAGHSAACAHRESSTPPRLSPLASSP